MTLGSLFNVSEPHFLIWQDQVKSLSHARLFATPWTVAYHAPPSMGFSRQEYWSGLPFPSPEDVPDPGIEPGSPALQADALLSEAQGKSSFPYLANKATNVWPQDMITGNHGCKVTSTEEVLGKCQLASGPRYHHNCVLAFWGI